ncbi:transcription-repair coupling factor [Psittacicella hinzii]|uniref:Transcription-repair-coupling factor n=1 Tax=Psittacicella hinzii TaxID=2028575 RepID=A0A3A1YJE0_9GAMM|nr:DEAD/DEAH box helicase [Psittacicella hinzii]RIY37170.1 hypothetical protein CKF58_05115 [Psittacicella hinzii]
MTLSTNNKLLQTLGLPFNLSFSQTPKIARVVESAIPFLVQQQMLELLAQAPADGQLVVIANSNNQAEYLYTILSELAGTREQGYYPVYLCPDWGTLAYDQFNPSAHIVSERIAFLQALGTAQPGIYIISLPTALHRLSPSNYLVSTTNYAVGQQRSKEQVVADLETAGYRQVEVVYEPGEFTLAGRNINFFPMGATFPFRISFFEDEIERIRQFDPETQQVIGETEQIAINHGSEYPIDEVGRHNFLQNFVKYFNQRISIDSNSVYELLNSGIIAQGVQYYLPLLFNQPLSSLADYLKSSHTQVVYFSGYQQQAELFLADNTHRYHEREGSRTWPPMRVTDLYLNADELFSQLRARAQVIEYEDYFTTLAKQAAAGVPVISVSQANTNQQALKTNLNFEAADKEFNTQQLSWQAEHTSAFLPLDNLQQTYVGNTVAATNDEQTVEQRFNYSEKEQLITLGLNRYNQPIMGDRTLEFLQQANQLTLKSLFAPKINTNHQLIKLVQFIRKLKANFSRVQITLTVANQGRINPFYDLVEELPFKFIEQPDQVISTALQFSQAYKPFTGQARANRALMSAAKENPAAERQAVELACVVSSLRSGFAYYSEEDKTAYVVLSEQDVLGSFQVRSRTLARTKQKNATQVIQGLLELRPGQLLVHQAHGICRYLGLKTYEYTPGFPEEMLELEFSDTKLSVPVRDLHLLSIYSHQIDPDLDPRLLSAVSGRAAKRWLKQREAALASIRDLASELLEVQSRRELEKGFAYTLYQEMYDDFVSHFRYEETPDQYATIQQVLDDMMSEKKMDRLICGDVGFGKTEIAMRAAFVAITNAKQVAILVPTTLLAKQHFESFRDRFAHTGANIELLSSFNTATENNRTLDRLEQGLVDIVIGTHALLQKRTKFKDLGLLIIDEEHQFGVKQKETIKALKANIDVITMTATPIPRTLNLALNGFRNISLIATAPPNRLSIITKMVNMADEDIIRDAINRELQRGGQVFFIHNDIGTMNTIVTRLRELVPHARVVAGNGQMAKGQLEEVMLGFHNQRYNVLVCSTIIETGIDVPNANTIIINNAQNFGMAQLHQLRGRVGRSFRQAYAYLVVPSVNNLNDDANLRLKSLIDIDSLGAGYILATHDLEIRGAGEILGDNQSGKVDTIGYSLYMSMLQNAVKQLRRQQELNLDNLMDKRIDLELNIVTIIPDAYIHAANLRVFYYRQISAATSEFQLDEIANSMIENFGNLPKSVRALFMLNKLRLRYQDTDLVSIIGDRQKIVINFSSTQYINGDALFALVTKHPGSFVASPNSLTIKRLPLDDIEQIKVLAQVLNIIMSKEKLSAQQVYLQDAASSYARSENAANRKVATGKGTFASQVHNPRAEVTHDTTKEVVEVASELAAKQSVTTVAEQTAADADQTQVVKAKRRGRPRKVEVAADKEQNVSANEQAVGETPASISLAEDLDLNAVNDLLPGAGEHEPSTDLKFRQSLDTQVHKIQFEYEIAEHQAKEEELQAAIDRQFTQDLAPEQVVEKKVVTHIAHQPMYRNPLAAKGPTAKKYLTAAEKQEQELQASIAAKGEAFVMPSAEELAKTRGKTSRGLYERKGSALAGQRLKRKK